MSRRFVTRVQVERRVLRSINARLHPVQLHGLAPRAIAVWDQQIDWTNCADRRSRILDGVLEVSKLCQALADQSRGAFDPMAFDEETVDRKIAALTTVIDDAFLGQRRGR